MDISSLMICMSISHGSNGKSLTSSLLVCVRSVDKLNVPSCLFFKTTSTQLRHPCIPHKTSLHNLQVRTTKVSMITLQSIPHQDKISTHTVRNSGDWRHSLKSCELAPRDGFIAPDHHKGEFAQSLCIWVPRLWWPKTTFDTSHPCLVALNEDCWQNRWKLP